MLPSTQHDSLAARVRAIYRDAHSMYRAHFGFIIGSAALVLVPFAILDGMGLIGSETSSARPWVIAATVFVAIATTGLSSLAGLFYAGLLDYTADAWNEGAEAPSHRSVAHKLPWLQLVIASVIAFVVEIVGLMTLVLPGLVLYTLFVLTGPMLVRERLTAVAALKRSAGLVRRNPTLVVLTVLLPSMVESSIADFAGLIFGHHLAIELVAEVVVTLFAASFVGVLEVITAQHLQRAHPPEGATTNSP